MPVLTIATHIDTHSYHIRAVLVVAISGGFALNGATIMRMMLRLWTITKEIKQWELAKDELEELVEREVQPVFVMRELIQ